MISAIRPRTAPAEITLRSAAIAGAAKIVAMKSAIKAVERRVMIPSFGRPARHRYLRRRNVSGSSSNVVRAPRPLVLSRLGRRDQPPAMKKHHSAVPHRKPNPRRAADFRQRSDDDAQRRGTRGVVDDGEPLLELALHVPGAVGDVAKTRSHQTGSELGGSEHAHMGGIAQ